MRSENGTFPAVHAPPTDACRARRALPLPMHAARTPGAFHFEPLLRGGARPKYGDSIITARLSRRPKQATAHSPRLARIISLPQRCRCGVRRGLFLFPAPVLSCLRRPPMFGSTTPSTPLSPPAGRRPAAVRAKAPDTDGSAYLIIGARGPPRAPAVDEPKRVAPETRAIDQG